MLFSSLATTASSAVCSLLLTSARRQTVSHVGDSGFECTAAAPASSKAAAHLRSKQQRSKLFVIV
jgi:hypothetical protein